METLSERLTELIFRVSKGNQKEFSEATKIPASTLNEYVTGKKLNPRKDFLEKIKFAFPNVNIDWLLNGGQVNMLIGDLNELNESDLLKENEALKRKVDELNNKLQSLTEKYVSLLEEFKDLKK